jgi:hypothetical protein
MPETERIPLETPHGDYQLAIFDYGDEQQMIWLTRGEYEVLKAALRTLRDQQPGGDEPVAVERFRAETEGQCSDICESVTRHVARYVEAVTDAHLAGTLTPEKAERLHGEMLQERLEHFVKGDIDSLIRHTLERGRDLVNRVN